MSTDDVPGYKPEHRDELAMGCWAEHADGSLIVVESTEGGRVVYSIFDTSLKPVTEFRDAMAEGAFKTQYSWKGKGDRWTWHDKTPFPWDRVIAAGARPGTRYADVEDTLSEAERVRRMRMRMRNRAMAGLTEFERREFELSDDEVADNAAQRARHSRDITVGRPVDPEELAHRWEHFGDTAVKVLSRLQAAISRLGVNKTQRKRGGRS